MMLPVLLTALAVLPADAGTLRGRVTGPAGQPLSDARVEVVEVHRHATTDAAGRYVFGNLPVGLYNVSFSLVGFRPVIRRVTISDGEVALDVTLTPAAVEIPALQVTASPSATSALNAPQPLAVVDSDALRTAQRPTLGETLGALPGLRNWSTGAGIGKPLIRGLGSNRVLVLADGQRVDGQQWGDEHGPNVGTEDAERVEVIRGPASVLYGSDALGGVINVVSPALPDAIGTNGFVNGRLSAGYGSNRSAPEGGVQLEGATGAFGFRGGFNGLRSDDIRTPTGTMANSGYEMYGGGGAAGLRGGWGSLAVEYAGRNERVEIHEDPEEEPDFTGFQRIADDRVKATLNLPVSGTSRLEAMAGWERNNRREYEAADDDEVGLGLLSKTLTGNVHLHHLLGAMSGILGASVLRNTFDKSGEETLIPNSTSSGVGAYLFEQVERGRWSFSFGARYDFRHLDVEADEDLGVEAQTRDWSSLTGNLGALFRVREPLAVVLNVGRGYRAPSSFELFSNGVHEGTVRFERGNPALRNETSFNTDLAVRVQTRRVTAEIGGFHNRISDYIYSDPTGLVDAESGYQVYDFTQGDATLTGFEASAEIHPVDAVHMRVAADYVRGHNSVLDQPLPFMPPFRLSYGVRWEGKGVGVLSAPYVDLGGETNSEQTRLDPEDFAPPGYTLFHIGAGAAVGLGGTDLRFDLQVRNLFDTEYTGFLSRYKLYAPDPGRNVVFRATLGI
ncbi:MAG TPA: TonB-dependent receptor [Gemmatimonadales bacterium]